MLTRRPSPIRMLVVGLVCAVTAGACWAISTTIRDRHTVINEANTIAKSEPVREEFAWQIAEALAPHSANTAPDALNRANDLANQAVRSPAFEQAFVAALPAIYSQVVDGTPGDVTLDPALVAQAFAVTGSPPPPNFALRVSRDQMPDLRGPLDVMHTLAGILGALGVILIGFGLAMAPHRGRAVMRIGRWLITVGLLTVFLFWALPTLALLPLGGWIGVIGIVLATGDWLVMPAAVLAGVGVAIVVMGHAGEAEDRRQELSVIPRARGRTPTHRSVV